MSGTEHWSADPTWPAEQQQLFRRLKDRFEIQLGLRDEPPKADPSPNEERKILDQISDRGSIF